MSTKKRKLAQTSIVFIPLGKDKAAAARPLLRVISGGQSGADTAALAAAHKTGFYTGGVSTEAIPAYNIDRVSADAVRKHGSALVARSIANVDRADGTVAFWAASSAGTDKTIGYCASGQWRRVRPGTTARYRPLLVVNLRESQNVELLAGEVLEFVVANNIATLNVAGHRDDNRALLPGYTKLVDDIMSVALVKIRREQAPLVKQSKRQRAGGLGFCL